MAGALTAAAAVAGVLAFAAVRAGDPAITLPIAVGSAPPPKTSELRFAPVAMKIAEINPRLMIDEPGWKVADAVKFTPTSGEIHFRKGDRELTIYWTGTGFYHNHFADREQVSAPEPVQIDGSPAAIFRYSAHDFAAMLEPDGEVFAELRTGAGWTRAEFDHVIGRIKHVDVPTWLSSMPPDLVADSPSSSPSPTGT